MSLRRRVLLYLSLAAVASCALTVVVGAVLVRDRVAAARFAALQTQADTIAVVGGPRGARRPGEHVYRVGSRRARLAGPRLTAAVLAAVPASGDAQGRITIDGLSVIYAARDTGLGRIILIRRSKLSFSEWRPFLASLIIAGVGGALLAALLALILARRLTRPIGVLADATGRLAAGESEVQVPIDGDDELSELGRSFNRMSSELARARSGQRLFLESVSHELKTPLTSVRGYAEALQEGAIGPAEGGAVIAAESRRLERLVADLMDLARLERAGFVVEHERLDVPAVAAEAVARHRVRAAELGVGLELDPHAGEAVTAVGDSGRLLQATSNLIENALRLTPTGGTVSVATGPGTIAVSDTGPGLADEDLPRAFERFYLHDRYRSDPERTVGSGLGLAIVAELVTAMGGRVAAENRAQGGACFTITLASGAVGDDPPTASGRAATPARR